jgi:hypothetical protein
MVERESRRLRSDEVVQIGVVLSVLKNTMTLTPNAVRFLKVPVTTYCRRWTIAAGALAVTTSGELGPDQAGVQ